MAPIKNYTPQQMGDAIEAVRKGQKIAVAAKKFGVPRITLHNKVTGISPVVCPMGPTTYLSKLEEDILEQWVLLMNEKHMPVTKDQLLDSVQKIVKDKGQDTPFKDSRPGKKWYELFLKRHPVIAERTAENLCRARDNVTQDDIEKWFKEVEDYLQENNLMSVFDEPERVFNTDESAFFLSPKPGKVLAKRGEKHVYSSSGDDKENLTVLVTGNAAGQLAPTMVIYPYERVPMAVSSSFPSDWALGRSPSGWMYGATFYEYMANIFNPWLQKNKIKKPILFFLDGHKSHMTLHLSNFCVENQITIIALNPNSTHILQPMDIAVFRPLKVLWRKAVTEWKLNNSGNNLKKENFAPVLKPALAAISPETIKNGFRCGGICPFGPSYIDVSKFKSKKAVPTQTYDVWFLQHLEKEIKKKFNPEKLQLFEQLYYTTRSEVDDLLPIEDSALYVIWASAKHSATSTRDAIKETTILASPNTTNTSIQVQSGSSFVVPENSHTGDQDSACTATSETDKNRHTIMFADIPQVANRIDTSTTNDRSLQVQSDIYSVALGNSHTSNPHNVLTKYPEIEENRLLISPSHDLDISDAIFDDVQENSTTATLHTVNDMTNLGPSYTIVSKQLAPGSSLSEHVISAQQASPQIQENTTTQLSEENVNSSPFVATARANTTVSSSITADSSNAKSSNINVSEKSISEDSNKNSTGYLDKIQISVPLTQAPPATSAMTPKDSEVEPLLGNVHETNNIKTPVKTSCSTGLPGPSNALEYVPSPFKRNLFWPGEEDPKKGRKRKLREKIPFVVTSPAWIQYHQKKDNEKRNKLEEKQRKAREREEKKLLKEKNALNKRKKVTKKLARSSDSSDVTDTEINFAESDDSYDVESDLFSTKIPMHDSSSSDSENIIPACTTSSQKKLSKGTYVIVKYEEEYFPGIIHAVHKNTFEVSTMTFSTGHTFRWPEKQDKIWYKRSDVIEVIDAPVLSNKRGFYTVKEMSKYLTYII